MKLFAAVMVGVAVVFCGSVSADEGDWLQWRGPNRDGISTDTGLLKKWPKNGPKLLWDAKGAGRGYASLVIGGGKIYTLGDAPSTASDKSEYLLCFDVTNGKQLWKKKLGSPWDKHRQESWRSSRSTPTLDGKRVYAMTGHGYLWCLESNDIPLDADGDNSAIVKDTQAPFIDWLAGLVAHARTERPLPTAVAQPDDDLVVAEAQPDG